MNVQNPSASRGIAIQAVDLVKNYGTGSNMVHALRGVNVSFERGKFTAIMGPSGSGKSTLMHTLAGLDSATSGHILFGGADLTRMDDKQLTLLRRHKIGFIFQSFNLLPMFTAEQNILMPLTLAGDKPGGFTDGGLEQLWKASHRGLHLINRGLNLGDGGDHAGLALTEENALVPLGEGVVYGFDDHSRHADTQKRVPDGDGIAEVDPLQESRILRLFP